MTGDVSKDTKERPTAQVFRLMTSGAGSDIEKLNKRNDDIYEKVTGKKIRKDLGPNGGANPDNAVQPNAFEPEDAYQQLNVGATRDQGVIQPPYKGASGGGAALSSAAETPATPTAQPSAIACRRPRTARRSSPPGTPATMASSPSTTRR